MAAASVEPAEQLVASPQGQMDQEAAMWLAKGHTIQQGLHTGWGGYHGRVSITAGAVARPGSWSWGGGGGYRTHKRAKGRKTKVKLTGAGSASCLECTHPSRAADGLRPLI